MDVKNIMGSFRIVNSDNLDYLGAIGIERAYYNYNSEKYSKFEFMEEQLIKIKPNFIKIKQWIETDCNGESMAILTDAGRNSPLHNHYYGEIVMFCFEEETDATAFKLKWM